MVVMDKVRRVVGYNTIQHERITHVLMWGEDNDRRPRTLYGTCVANDYYSFSSGKSPRSSAILSREVVSQAQNS